jgi:hypothetical protein
VLTVAGPGVRRVCCFGDPGLVGLFGFPGRGPDRVSPCPG